MARINLENGSALLTIRNAINTMFTELYDWFALFRIIDKGTAGVNIVGGVAENTINADASASTIAGGGNSTSFQSIGAADYATISGGYDNTIGANIASTISGGAHHTISGTATHGTIGGGSYNDIEGGDYGTIGGGTGHTLNAIEGTIAGGTSNTVSGRGGFVAGGSSNTVAANYSVINGGILNDIDSSSTYSTIAGGNTCLIKNSGNAYIGTGYQHKIGTASISGSASTIAGGYQNAIAQSTQAQYATIAGGRSNNVDGDYSTVLGGRNNDINSQHSVALGSYGKTTIFGQHVSATGQFLAAGDAQVNSFVLRKQTTDASTGEMRPDGSSQRIVLPDSTSWMFELNVVARRTDAIGGNAAYKLTGLISRDSGVASTAIVGTVSKTVIAETDSAWDVNVVAGTTYGDLTVQVTGEAEKTIQWVASLKAVSTTG